MNFQGKAILVFLEEDNIARAYFRVQPLMTQDGPLGPMEAVYPDDGFLRIVPDKNEQHTFKERMRALSGLCIVDLRLFSPEANKIRTNKNYAPVRGETNQYIVYSDAVRALPEDLLYQVVAENAVQSASTPQVYIRDGANIQGPFRREDGQPAGEINHIPPDSTEIHSVTVQGQDLLFYWPKAAETPLPGPSVEAMPAREEKEPLPQPAENDAPVKNAFEQIQALNEPISEHANRLRDPAPAVSPVVDYVQEQNKPLNGTRLYQAPLRQSAPRRAHNALMEAVENQRYAAKYETHYEAPGATIPASAELKEVHNPADALKRALQGMSACPETQRQAVDVLLAQPGIRQMLAQSLAKETNDLTMAAMHAQLQELEAERLMTLMQLDDAKKNAAAAREEALSQLTEAEQKALDQLRAAKESAQNALDALHQSMEPLEQKREEAAKKIEEMKAVLDQRLLCAPVGQDVSKEELTDRTEKALRAAGFAVEEGDALALLTALALAQETFEICSDTVADAQSALAALAAALGAPLVESDWDERLVLAPGGNAPVLLQDNGARHPLIWHVSAGTTSDRGTGDAWGLPYASVSVPVNQDALPTVLPEYAPVTRACIVKAFRCDVSLSEETRAVVAALRKGLKDAGAPMPLVLVDMICRFISATQNEFKGGVAEAIDRAVCLYTVPYLKENEVELGEVKSLFTAMPRTMKALNA